jgi:hypothetical protein
MRRRSGGRLIFKAEKGSRSGHKKGLKKASEGRKKKGIQERKKLKTRESELQMHNLSVLACCLSWTQMNPSRLADQWAKRHKIPQVCGLNWDPPIYIPLIPGMTQTSYLIPLFCSFRPRVRLRD